MRTVLLVSLVSVVLTLMAMFAALTREQKTQSHQESAPPVCLKSLSGFVPEHQGFYTTETGETISYAIPDQQVTHCIEWSK